MAWSLLAEPLDFPGVDSKPPAAVYARAQHYGVNGSLRPLVPAVRALDGDLSVPFVGLGHLSRFDHLIAQPLRSPVRIESLPPDARGAIGELPCGALALGLTAFGVQAGDAGL